MQTQNTPEGRVSGDQQLCGSEASWHMRCDVIQKAKGV